MDIAPLRRLRPEGKGRDLGIKDKRSYFFWYTVIFVVMAALCFRPFYENGKSLIWEGKGLVLEGDGLHQHYTELLYLSRWFRTILSERKIPMIDFTIGYGSDVIVTLGGALLSPINWVAALFNPVQLENVYCLMILVRYYLVGAAFSCYCFYMKQDYICTLAGAFAYTFCGYCLFAGVRHPSFLSPSISLPILLIYIEKLIAGEKGRWLITPCIAFVGIMSYYFCYMLLIVGAIYGIFRGIIVKKTVRGFLRLIWEAFLYGGLGIGMAAVQLLPAVCGLASSTRLNLPVYYANTALLYPVGYYRKLLMDFASPLSSGAGYWVYISVGAPATVAVVAILFMRQKEWKWLKRVFLILLLILCVPFAGSMMNGFNYVTNRWVWAVCFFAAYILVCEMGKLPDMPWWFVAGFAAVLCLALLYSVLKPKSALEHILGLTELLLFMVMVALFAASGSRKTGFHIAVLAFCLGSVLISSYCKYDPKRNDYISEFHSAGGAFDTVMSNAETSVRTLGDESFYRISSNTLGTAVNHGMAAGFNTVGHFWSILDDSIYQYLLGAEIPGMIASFRFYGLDQRLGLESLASVKYYAMQEESQEIVPTGYEWIDTEENPYSSKNDVIYRNPKHLPIGYTYDGTVRYQDYEKLNPVEKEQLMLRKLVLEDGDKLTDTDFLTEQIDYTLEDTENIEWDRERGTIEISKAGSELSLSYYVLEGDSIYIRMKGFNTDGNSKTAPDFTVATNGLIKEFYARNNRNTWPIPRENYTLNFGVSDGTEQMATITFPYKAEYKLEDIEIYAVPEYRYSEYLDKLRKECLKNVVVGTNLVEGDITVSNSRYLCFSIPYSKGWKAYIDGEPVDTIRANVMYMAVALEPGYHQVRLEYCTPGLKAGIMISVICSAVLVGFIIFLCKHENN